MSSQHQCSGKNKQGVASILKLNDLQTSRTTLGIAPGRIKRW
jgi:hypothetical protein